MYIRCLLLCGDRNGPQGRERVKASAASWGLAQGAPVHHRGRRPCTRNKLPMLMLSLRQDLEGRWRSSATQLAAARARGARACAHAPRSAAVFQAPSCFKGAEEYAMLLPDTAAQVVMAHKGWYSSAARARSMRSAARCCRTAHRSPWPRREASEMLRVLALFLYRVGRP